MWGLRPHAPTRSAGLRRRRIAPSTPAPIGPVNRRAPGGPRSPAAPLSVIPAKAGIHPGHRRGSGARRPTNPRGRTRAPLSVIPAKAGIHPGHRRGSGARRPTNPRGRPRTPFRHSGESRNPSGASEGVRRPPADKPPRPHPRPSPDRGKAPAGEPRSPPGTPPRPATQPQDPEWIVEGGCGGEPPLETTEKLDGSPLVRYNRHGEDRGGDATGINPTVFQRVTPNVPGLAPGAALRVAAGIAG